MEREERIIPRDGEVSKQDTLDTEQKAKIDSMRRLLGFQPVQVATTVPGEGDAVAERPPEEILAEKAEKTLQHFVGILEFKDGDVEHGLLKDVVKRCISIGFPCAQAIASASEAEFRELLIATDGACPEVGRPGHGRKLALTIHMVASAVEGQLAYLDSAGVKDSMGVRSIRRQKTAGQNARSRSSSGGSRRGESVAKRGSGAGTLERVVDALECRRKRRKARKAIGSGSSSTSSEGSFDLSKRLTSRRLHGFPAWALPERSVLRKLNRQSKGHKRAYVASKPFDEWVPSHVGKGLPTQERHAMLKRWPKECAKDATKVHESIQCFWLSHAVVGNDIPPEAVQAHLAVLSRMQYEYDLEFVVQYERYLHADVLDSVSDGIDIDFKTVLGTLNSTILQRLSAQKYRNIEERLRESEHKNRGQIPGAKASGKGVGVRQESTVGKGPSDRKTPLCLAHDLAKGTTCANATNGRCPHLHLDTRKGDEARRFGAAARAVDLRKGRDARRTPY